MIVDNIGDFHYLDEKLPQLFFSLSLSLLLSNQSGLYSIKMKHNNIIKYPTILAIIFLFPPPSPTFPRGLVQTKLKIQHLESFQILDRK